jgi:ectoine hydroxylase-related dioxygenase (phytanoyl-CoA dioxygenase family)
MAHYLREAGYLLVKGVFSADELEDFGRAVSRLRAETRPGDQRSWWCRSASGDEILCRILEANREPELAGLPADPRILSLVALADEKLVSKGRGGYGGVSVLFKNPDVAEGLSDLPWHRDCGMGGHASMCPTLVGSVFLRANTPEGGALRFLPGSWKTSYRFADAEDAGAEQGVVVPAEPGDLTLHYGDGWHAAPPPTSPAGPFRSCLLVSYEREGAFNHRGERHYNDVLLGDERGQVRNMRTVAAGRS